MGRSCSFRDGSSSTRTHCVRRSRQSAYTPTRDPLFSSARRPTPASVSSVSMARRLAPEEVRSDILVRHTQATVPSRISPPLMSLRR